MAVGATGGRKTARGSSLADDVHESAATIADDVGISDLATHLADAAKEQTRTLLSAAKGQAAGFADERKDGVAQTIADIASTIRDSGEGFADRPNIHGFVGAAADGLDQFASGLRDRSFAEIYGEVERFARRQPVTFGVGALAAGFVLARFIKSSADDLSKQNAARVAAAERASRARPAG